MVKKRGVGRPKGAQNFHGYTACYKKIVLRMTPTKLLLKFDAEKVQPLLAEIQNAEYISRQDFLNYQAKLHKLNERMCFDALKDVKCF